MGGIVDGKPSDGHVIWCGGDGKQFDFEYLALWAALFGYEFGQWERVDRERPDQPGQRQVCVFARGVETESSPGRAETGTADDGARPRTFLEIDEAGVVRLRGWNTDTTIAVTELSVDGRTLTLRTVDGETKSVNTSRLADEPERTPA
jgi:hypothetical protein